MTLVAAAVRIDDDDPAVAVAVGNVGFVGQRFDEDLRRSPEVLLVVAALLLARPADLENELAGGRELEDMAVLVVVAANPDMTLVIDAEAMFAQRPVVALTGSAPRVDERTVGAELEDRRRGDAAVAKRRIQRRGLELDVDA